MSKEPKERDTEAIRISKYNKLRMNDLKGDQTYDSILTNMLDYVINMDGDPRYRLESPYTGMMNDIHQIRRYIQEMKKDYLQPILLESESSHIKRMNQEQAEIIHLLKMYLTRERESYERSLKHIVSVIDEALSPDKFMSPVLGKIVVQPSYLEEVRNRVRNYVEEQTDYPVILSTEGAKEATQTKKNGE